jgi:ABC-type antimicrobial peptide transport system, ATPase component
MIELENINKIILQGKHEKISLFNNLNLLVEDKMSISIMGKSGSGKTTLLKIMAGLILDYEGNYIFDGQIISKKETDSSDFRKENIGYITQEFNLLDNESVLNNVQIGNKNLNKDEIKQVLKRLSIIDLMNIKIKNLSGGERQRVVIARTLLKKPKIILADEPTGSLDEKTSQEVLTIFKELMQDGIQFVIVTHDKNVSHICQEEYELSQQRLTKIKE